METVLMIFSILMIFAVGFLAADRFGKYMDENNRVYRRPSQLHRSVRNQCHSRGGVGGSFLRNRRSA